MNHKREIFDGLIRLHVLLHAAQEPIFGLAMMHELEHHGYHVGPGTLYPLMHGMEHAGLLKSGLQRVEGRRRRLYRITLAGKRALEIARVKVDELQHELHEERPRRLGGESGA
jgi:DNA-binding PadR family transcriptional regulator